MTQVFHVPVATALFIPFLLATLKQDAILAGGRWRRGQRQLDITLQQLEISSAFSSVLMRISSWCSR
jgi:hypothetical protein